MHEVFVDGVFVARDEARIGVFDAGLQHGVGLFETMTGAVREGAASVVRLEAHMARLAASARDLGLSDALKTDGLGEGVIETVRRAGYERARVRLTITGGDLNLLEASARSQHRPTVVINATPASAYPPEMFERGIAVTIADARANPLDPTAAHKTLNYWWRLRELQAAAAKGAGEAIVLQVSNHLCGGCVSNVFVVKDGVLLTPIARGEEKGGAIPSPVLPGVTRAAVIEWAEGAGIEVRRQMLGVGDLLDGDEVFLTNSGWGVLPVVKVEAEAVGDGQVGGVAKGARGCYLK